MESVQEAEQQLNSIVNEYLEYMGCMSTVETFKKDLESMGRPVQFSVPSSKTNGHILDIEKSILNCFETGNYERFIKLWNENVSEKTRKVDLECQKLEFKIHLYFAIFPLVNNLGKTEAKKMKEYFKRYLETTGSVLSQTTEFLPYFALPFIPDVMEHPSFKPILTDTWRNNTKMQLQEFLSDMLKNEEKPELYYIFTSRQHIFEKERQQYNDYIKVLKTQLSEAETKLMNYFKKFSQIQGDYHKLIGIAAELVDSLEDTIRGKIISSEYIQDLCRRLFITPAQQSVDLTKPGTTSNMLRESISRTSVRNSVNDMPYRALNFEKIKKDLVSSSERRIAFLLQALRWRLTRSSDDESRNSAMRAYIGNDLLGCAFPGEYQESLIELLRSSNDIVCQYFARLLNTIASMSAGRSYLSQSTKLAKALQKALMAEPVDLLTSENILGCLQKLSLRRHLQTQMIENNLIPWLIDVLEEHDSLSDYTLEYSVALLMNLCLRTAGKQKCSHDASHILRVLSDLLGHENHEIRPYVNGSLYSILAVSNVREQARDMGMQEILECFLKDEDVDMQRQVQFIIKQLNLESEESSLNSDEYSDDEDENIDEEGDAIDEEFDKVEALEASLHERSGEELLMSEYAILQPSERSTQSRKSQKSDLMASLDQPLSRPATPGVRTIDNKLDNIPRPRTTVLGRIPESVASPRTSQSPVPSRTTSAKSRESSVSHKSSRPTSGT
ncbi:lisH domain-containing protein ARMC9-like [Xenia sp. Carnegie-2017]|uniref:lisH domain-containing protein ARMC9-like n=1 Tax=Xenia sp. Carnegie-2017 TaxID=2897299 RepID=UPI001F038B7A|nr:lisH domain-containing protein ARMC9-like [Xenia sp. Carnegie-2017]XP_046850760.1 lisH domain-containing protein ARMC9-like [Xenia sp. Carnegie-2017]